MGGMPMQSLPSWWFSMGMHETCYHLLRKISASCFLSPAISIHAFAQSTKKQALLLAPGKALQKLLVLLCLLLILISRISYSSELFSLILSPCTQQRWFLEVQSCRQDSVYHTTGKDTN